MLHLQDCRGGFPGPPNRMHLRLGAAQTQQDRSLRLPEGTWHCRKLLCSRREGNYIDINPWRPGDMQSNYKTLSIIMAAALIATTFSVPADARAKKQEALQRRADATSTFAGRAHNRPASHLRLRHVSI
jgi:hypothetical protein